MDVRLAKVSLCPKRRAWTGILSYSSDSCLGLIDRLGKRCTHERFEAFGQHASLMLLG